MTANPGPARRVDGDDHEWLASLRLGGENHDGAVAELRVVLRRAAAYQLRRMPWMRAELGAVRVDEIIETAVDHATLDVLAGLDRFEGRSRFTTWVYKFGILHAATEARRTLWRNRPVPLDTEIEPVSDDAHSPASHVEALDLAAAVRAAMDRVLTPHQRQVAVALLVDEIPIDVLAESMETTRNTLYKTLHDARVKLRAELRRRGHLSPRARDEVST